MSKARRLFQSRGWRIVSLALAVLLLVLVVDQLGRVTISTTKLVVNGLRSAEPVELLAEALASPWHAAEYPRLQPSTQGEATPLTLHSVTEDTPKGFWDVYAKEFQEFSTPIARTLTFGVEDGSLTARYDLKLPLNHPLARALQSGEGLANPQDLVDELLGRIKIDDYGDNRSYVLQFTGPYFKVDEFAAKLHVWLEARQQSLLSPTDVWIRLFTPAVIALPFDPDQIMVRYDEGLQVQASRHYAGQVIQRDERQLILRRQANDFGYTLYLKSEEARDVAPIEQSRPPRSEPRRQQTIVSVIKSLSISPPVLGVLLFSLLESLPLLLFLHYTSRLPQPPGEGIMGKYRLIIGLFLVFHFGLYTLGSIDQAQERILHLLGDKPIALDAFFPFAGWYRHYGFIAVALVFAGYLWPRVARRSTQAHTITLAEKATPIGRLLLALLLGVAAIVYLSDDMRRPLWEMLGAWLAVGTLLVLLASSAVLKAVVARQRRWRSVLFITALLIVLPVVMALLFEHPVLFAGQEPSQPPTLFWVLPAAVYLAAAIPMFYYLADSAYRAFSSGSLRTDRRQWPKWGQLALLIGLIVLAYPTRWLVDGDMAPKNEEEIFGLAYMLDNLIRYPFLGILLLILHSEASSHGSQLSPLARNMGVLIALTFFYSPTIRWLYVPIVFLLGYWVLTRWLLVENVQLTPIADKVRDKRREIIQAMVSQKYIKHALRQLKRSLVKNADDPTFDLAAHNKKVGEFEAALATSQSQEPLQIDGIPTSNLALAVGPDRSDWQNGKRAALYSLVFALPWIVLYFRDLVVNPNLSDSHIVLHFVGYSLSHLTQWILYGFFFGYFFAYIRGRNGLRKGLAYFLALLLPHLAITLIFVPADIREWPEFGLWALQLFTQTMLLGLIAGDYESLRRSRLGWFQLFEVHNISALASWASSTSLAIGAAISTLLAGYGQDLLRSAFQLGRMVEPGLPSP